jgi:hypothetical protein
MGMLSGLRGEYGGYFGMRVYTMGGRYVCSGRVDKSPKKVNRSTLDKFCH